MRNRTTGAIKAFGRTLVLAALFCLTHVGVNLLISGGDWQCNTDRFFPQFEDVRPISLTPCPDSPIRALLIRELFLSAAMAFGVWAQGFRGIKACLTAGVATWLIIFLPFAIFGGFDPGSSERINHFFPHVIGVVLGALGASILSMWHPLKEFRTA